MARPPFEMATLPGAASTNDRLVVFEQDPGPGITHTGRAAILDRGSDAWEMLATPPSKLVHADVGVTNARLVAVGLACDAGACLGGTPTLMSYDFADGSWSEQQLEQSSVVLEDQPWSAQALGVDDDGAMYFHAKGEILRIGTDGALERGPGLGRGGFFCLAENEILAVGTTGSDAEGRPVSASLAMWRLPTDGELKRQRWEEVPDASIADLVETDDVHVVRFCARRSIGLVLAGGASYLWEGRAGWQPLAPAGQLGGMPIFTARVATANGTIFVMTEAGGIFRLAPGSAVWKRVDTVAGGPGVPEPKFVQFGDRMLLYDEYAEGTEPILRPVAA